MVSRSDDSQLELFFGVLWAIWRARNVHYFQHQFLSEGQILSMATRVLNDYKDTQIGIPIPDAVPISQQLTICFVARDNKGS
ncbi:conserved hypothetical protein [Ricinus communis]|uniref:Uncharacterized protein n=1 Tax=Ricinus communis TaxID=3988 RepID=B9T7V9_RICCO|nr:conserved hypothetical protein [Ricinus communis]